MHFDLSEKINGGMVLIVLGILSIASPVLAQQPVTEVFADWNNVHKWDSSNGDTWDPFWADDDNLYSFNDDGRGFAVGGARNLAFHKLAGAGVTELVGSPVNSMDEYGKAGKKEKDNATWKACGQECIDSVFYAFVSRHVYGKESNDPEMRQTAFNTSLIKSTDKGVTWTRSAADNYKAPMWPGPRFGAPYFFHYGKNGGQVTQDAADQFVYALSPNGFWNNGDDYILGRVPRAKLAALNASDWSYFVAGDGVDNGSWSSDLSAAKPILALKSKCGMTGPSYVPALKSYLLVAWYNKSKLKKWYEPDEMIYEFYQSPHPWGVWTSIGSVSDNHIVGGHMYGPAICAKFQEQVGLDTKVWMFTSGCPFEDKPTGLYKAWAIPLVLRTAPVSASTLVNDDDPAIAYTGQWAALTQRKRSNHNGDVHYTTTPNDSAAFTFTGTGVEFLSEKYKDTGDIDIFLDGALRQTVKLKTTNFPPLVRVTVFSVRDLPAGRHTLKIVNKSAAYAVIDAFRVYGGSK